MLFEVMRYENLLNFREFFETGSMGLIGSMGLFFWKQALFSLMNKASLFRNG